MSPKIILLKRVYIASPCRTTTMKYAYDHYLDNCLKDSLSRGEAPYAPHAYLPRFLPDTNPRDRDKALDIGNKFLLVCQLLAVYTDFGISEGMQNEVDFAKANNVPIQMRKLNE